jgi:AcrR family transcriptional regulator
VDTPLASPLRADAQRNRDQLIAAAARTFEADGPDVPMEEIARAAGVGVGTLYRRFADRDSLMVAVVQHHLAAFVDRIRTVVAEEPLAWDALVRSMGELRALKLSLPLSGLLPAALATAVREDEAVRGMRTELDDLTAGLVTAAQAEGSLRPDVGAGDVARLFALVYRAAAGGGADDLVTERALAVILDGLRTGEHRALPGRPLGLSDLGRR